MTDMRFQLFTIEANFKEISKKSNFIASVSQMTIIASLNLDWSHFLGILHDSTKKKNKKKKKNKE